MLGFFRGPILDQRIAFNETGLPVEVQVKLLNLAIVSESIIDIVFLGLFMDVRYDNDPSLNRRQRCTGSGRFASDRLELTGGAFVPLIVVVCLAMMAATPGSPDGRARLVVAHCHCGRTPWRTQGLSPMAPYYNTYVPYNTEILCYRVFLIAKRRVVIYRC